MKCRQCGTEIADKALICYRCGTATTEAKFKPAALRARRPIGVVFVLSLILLMLLVWEGVSWIRPPAVDGYQTIRWVAIVLVAVLAVLAVLSRRLRRR
jgi:hypothetical protein